MNDADSLRQIAQSRAPFSVWFGTVLLFLLFGAIVLALMGPAGRRDPYQESKGQKRLDNLKTLHEADAKALSGYGWVDKAKGTVHIPIDRAMQLTLAELSRKKPAAAYPIATATPAAAPAAQASPVASAAPKSGSSPVASPAASAGNQPGANSAAQASPAAPAGKPTASPVGTPNQKASATPAAGQTPAPTP